MQLFIHDSLHTARNMLFEMERPASATTPGGVMLIDDIKCSDAFVTFAKRHPEYQTLRCHTADRVCGFGVAVLPRRVRPGCGRLPRPCPLQDCLGLKKVGNGGYA